ncbi:MAG: hypothetical protein CWE10_19835 [Symbiobacterium thermophilum]|uniref:Uncharacterized protein n=1 Tax=Symbiobacterium thermophilum TaxID=2734 RepID=A0A953I670_SYMTR|nr:hypothetical protein [Symbiobacterium thermophilum]
MAVTDRGPGGAGGRCTVPGRSPADPGGHGRGYGGGVGNGLAPAWRRSGGSGSGDSGVAEHRESPPGTAPGGTTVDHDGEERCPVTLQQSRSLGTKGTLIRLLGITRTDLRQYLGGAA